MEEQLFIVPFRAFGWLSEVVTNTIQLIFRLTITAVLLGRFGVLAIPIAFAFSSGVEAFALALVLWRRVRTR